VWSIFAVAFLTVFAAEILHRQVGRAVEAVPGWTNEEYIEHASQVKLDRDVVFLGDSRVGWGIAEKSITEALHQLGATDVTVFNLGLPGTSIADEIDFLRLHQWAGRLAGGGIMMIHYSPAGWYSFIGIIGQQNGGKKTAVGLAFRSLITTNPSLVREDLGLFKQHGALAGSRQCYWSSRTVFPEGFVNGTRVCGGSLLFDRSQSQLDTYRSVFSSQEFKSSAALRKATILKKIRQLQADGWRVVMVRLPLGPRMRQIDESIAADLQGPAVAAQLGVPFIDYLSDPNAADIRTQDESHLTPDSARRLVPILAADLMRISSTPRPAGRR
jgi:hypothetical protein